MEQRTADVGHPRDIEKIGYRWAASVLRKAPPPKPPAQNQAAKFLKMLEKSRL